MSDNATLPSKNYGQNGGDDDINYHSETSRKLCGFIAQMQEWIRRKFVGRPVLSPPVNFDSMAKRVQMAKSPDSERTK